MSASRRPVTDAMHAVIAEVLDANAKHGTFTSSHEGYGVLAEEVAELLDAIHDNDREAVRREATQVAAVAVRIVAACEDPAFCVRSGFKDPTA